MAIRDRNKGGKAARPDLSEILARFSDARSFLECGVRLLEDWDEEAGPGPGDESVCLRHGLDLMVTAYKELDLAVAALSRGMSEL
jgi:hypothetical protein